MPRAPPFLVNHADHASEEEAEGEDLRLARRRHRVDDVLGQHVEEARDDVVVRDEGPGDPDPGEQREDDLTKQYRQADGE